jgi:sulfite reductase (NADPH) flavoprotein alpha-component
VNPVPQIPESAPFTPQQRAWLNGFFAGLFSSQTAPVAPEPRQLSPITILFGSQTGNAETLAKKAAAAAGKRGFAPTVLELGGISAEQLQKGGKFLVITSTYGDGDPPDNAKPFWEKLKNGSSPQLDRFEYSVLALGDSNYPKFCEFGRLLDGRFEELGGKRVAPRVDCDVDFDGAFQKWLDATLAALGAEQAAGPAAEPKSENPAYSRTHPYPAKMTVNRVLNAPGSAKETRHLEIALGDSGLVYEAGDALGVAPSNCPELVDRIMQALGAADDATRAALTAQYEINRVPPGLLELAGAPKEYGTGRDVLDLLTDFPSFRPAPAEFLGLLKKLPPRLYSISSSPKADEGSVHLTVGVVRYESQGRARKGVCSTYLGERVTAGSTVPIFVHPNKNFRPPADDARPMIMVGPGTGIAPFRAFLRERQATGADGKNWLFFGDQHAATDFLYRDEMETMQAEGVLTRLDTAFSRDQAHKIYVQDRLIENSRELFEWLEAGAHFYICGDAKRMAGDVDKALHKIVESVGGKSAEQAQEYVARLKSEKRYQRDVY